MEAMIPSLSSMLSTFFNNAYILDTCVFIETDVMGN